LKIVQKRGLKETEQQLKRDGVKTLGCDGINRRKGNSNSACTVFIDADTKLFLTLVPGKNGDVVEDFLKLHPLVKTMTRDRATAYASAGNKAGIKQVADRFHLFDNLHHAIKKEINLQLPLKVIIGDIRSESSLSGAKSRPENIHDLSQSKNPTVKFRGLDKKKSGKRPSNQSIAEPFKDTSLKMFHEGKKHREIFEEVKKKGFGGSRNCIYQYIKKYTDENNIPYGRSGKQTSVTNEISRSAVYNKLIRYTSSVMTEDSNPNESSPVCDDKSSENIIIPQNEEAETCAKKLSDEQYKEIKSRFPLLECLENVRIDFFKIFSTEDVTRLEGFIQKYENSEYGNIKTFARGLKKDYDGGKFLK